MAVSGNLGESSARRPLRVMIITEDDPLYVVKFFEVFLAQVPSSIDIVGITVSRAFHEPMHKTARRILRFYGMVDFSRLLWRWGVAKLLGRGIGASARTANVQLIEAASVNDASYLERLQALKIDVLVSVAAPEIFRAPLLSVPALGCLNIHSGRLPQYRGMMPTFWQLKNGESVATITIHEMAEKLDAGGVIATREFPVAQADRLDRVITGTKREGARLMLQTLTDIATSGKFPEGQPLDMTQARYYRFPASEDVRAFRARGHKLL